ncbi:hypothetical protein HH310_14210 [Actinoplanes sp. TBRC 11911]|uniref:hypothetical protein n=1 Tax=Actinoplanes sp. TBRC 11911 TaxID=2729386 RepID=UPI00145FBEBA|nr:hypothetical protein [Actinoplanes sp. TBRC 11911]NMO52347.1 hypothetical protein [Actinoplanes sp. TBRC 11911]
MVDSFLVRSAALGAASGARSLTPLAMLALRRGGWLRAVTAAGALGELIGDKLPGTPSRLHQPELTGRVAAGALAGALLARRHGRPVLPSALAAGAAALGASYAGAAWRKYRPGIPAALAEDAAAVGVAWAVTRG